jgi:Lrp/AsnC family transcriptional regulator
MEEASWRNGGKPEILRRGSHKGLAILLVPCPKTATGSRHRRDREQIFLKLAGRGIESARLAHGAPASPVHLMRNIDTIDRRILEVLQADASASLQQVSEAVNLSTTPCWRRIQRLESEGIIRKRVALLDADKLNVGVTVFVSIRTNEHNEEWLRRLSSVVEQIPQIVEFYRMSGDVDYLLRIVVPDIKAYDAVYKRLIREIDLSDVSSSFAMEQIKFTTALPLEYA